MALPNDIARCVGRRELTPEDRGACQVRNSCRRYMALHSEPIDAVATYPVVMHLCSNDEHAQRLPVEA